MRNLFPLKSNLFKGISAILLVAFFGVLAMLAVFVWGFPVGADLDNHFRFALPLYDEIAQGNYFPGWLAESNNGFGDPRFRFYPPILYYLLCFFKFLVGDWFWASVLVFTLFSIIGALGIYFWTRRNFTNKTAIIAALLFAFVPYHLTQFYQASLLAEFAATALFPFAFLFVEKLMTERRENLRQSFSDIAALAAVYSLIITIHLPSTVLISFTLGIYALLLTDWKTNKRGLILCAAAILLGLLSSSWFWVKMISELGLIQAGEKVGSPYYDYRNNFVFSPFAPANLNTFYGSLVAALTLGIFLPSIIIWRKIIGRHEDFLKNFAADKKIISRRLLAILMIAFLSFFMTTDLSRPIWAIVPKLKDIQFPFRWLTITSVVICPLVAFSLQIWREKLTPKKFRAVYLPVLLIFLFTIFYTVESQVIESEFISHEEFNSRVEKVRGGRSFNDWLPRNAKELKDLTPLSGNIEAGTRQISVIEWQTHRRIFKVEKGAATAARLRTYFYLFWQAFAVSDAQKIPLQTSQAEDGTLLVAIPAEETTVEVVFTEPPRTRISQIIAALGWTITFALLIIRFTKPGKNEPEQITIL